ncbi:hypothetical protein BH10PSE2_BH10PSE2_02590 [soil metagenome]
MSPPLDTREQIAPPLPPLMRAGLILLVGCCLCASLIGSLF